jgi:glycosyltransferase involved in cell wall biosynthesis
MMPVYNDWNAVSLLLPQLDQLFADRASTECTVFIVDDASGEQANNLVNLHLHHIKHIYLLHLKRNLGHQRAITIGLMYIYAEHVCDAVVVMDGDGEDKAVDVIRLMEELQKEQHSKMIFAERTKRSEGMIFCLFYFIYRMLHFVLTGSKIRVGNFSIIPYAILSRLTSVSELWSHYAAGIFKAKIPYKMMPTSRGYRLHGVSRMNFVGLVTHGISSLAVFGEIVGVRLLLFSLLCCMAIACLLLTVILIRLTTMLAIPGWATYTCSILLVLFSQIFLAIFLIVFYILASRNNLSFIPIRDYRYFVDSLERIEQA